MDKKIGIMSMQRIINYGSFLQAYGLKKMIESISKSEVEFVDYRFGTDITDRLKRKQERTESVMDKVLKNRTPWNYLKKMQFFKEIERRLIQDLKEMGVDELVCSWKALAPAADWESAYHTEALKATEVGARLDELVAEIGEAETVAAPAPKEGQEDSSGNFSHTTVLLHETVEMLAPATGKLIVDCTLGGGGHTELLLEQGATVWGIDRDPDARRAATLKLARFGSRFKVLAGNFQDVESLLAQQGVSRVDGLLADLGVSSHQLDTASRGFSFREDGPLDMRMDTRSAFSARNLVNEAPEEELADILWQYGEERASRAIARAIVKARSQAPIATTGQLARIVESVLPRKGRQHPGTRTFQALRIAVNGELDALDSLLASSVGLLGKGGRLAVITFHSLEDRRVKQFFDLHSRPEIDRPEWPAPRPNPDYCFRLLSRKPVTAGEEELSTNPRSRSAKLRGVEKII